MISLSGPLHRPLWPLPEGSSPASLTTTGPARGRGGSARSAALPGIGERGRSTGEGCRRPQRSRIRVRFIVTAVARAWGSR